jgi:hypothetical protein
MEQYNYKKCICVEDTTCSRVIVCKVLIAVVFSKTKDKYRFWVFFLEDVRCNGGRVGVFIVYYIV